jgi:hypothetical protein
MSEQSTTPDLVELSGRVIKPRQRGWVTLRVQGKIARVTIFLDPASARAAAERLAESRG